MLKKIFYSSMLITSIVNIATVYGLSRPFFTAYRSTRDLPVKPLQNAIVGLIYQERLRDLSLRNVTTDFLVVTDIISIPTVIASGIKEINEQKGMHQYLHAETAGLIFSVSSVDNIHTFSLANATTPGVLEGMISNTYIILYNAMSEKVLTATASATPETLIMRDQTGSFSAHTMSALDAFYGNLIGQSRDAISSNSTIAVLTSFYADVIGTQTTLSVVTIDGKSAQDISVMVDIATNCRSTSIPNTTVLRDATSSFSINNLYANGNCITTIATATTGKWIIGTTPALQATNNSFFAGLGAGSNGTGSTDCYGIGRQALASITTGTSNIAVGYNTLAIATATSNVIAIGTSVLSILNKPNSGIGSTIIGNNTLTNVSNASTDALVVIGNNSCTSSQGLISNTIVGNKTYQPPTSLSSSPNLAIGNKISTNSSFTSSGLAIGNKVHELNGAVNVTGTVIGTSAMQNSTQFGATAIGYKAAITLSTVGSNASVVVVGPYTYATASGTNNTNNFAIGPHALENINVNSGRNITAMGSQAFAFLPNSDSFEGIGYQVGINYTSAHVNRAGVTNIGRPGTLSEQNLCKIANISSQYSISSPNIAITSGFRLQRSTSSAQYKQDIQPLTNNDIALIDQLRPVSYVPIDRIETDSTIAYGFIAEEVALISPGLAQYELLRTTTLPIPEDIDRYSFLMSLTNTNDFQEIYKPNGVNYYYLLPLLSGYLVDLRNTATTLEYCLSSSTMTLYTDLDNTYLAVRNLLLTITTF